MFFPIGSPQTLKFAASVVSSPTAATNENDFDSTDDEDRIQCIATNRERLLVGVCSHSRLAIYFIRPFVELCGMRRPRKLLQQQGRFVRLLWKPDSAAIVALTDRPYMLFFALEFAGDSHSYLFKDAPERKFQRSSADLFQRDQLPHAAVKLSFLIQLSSIPKSISTFREELVVCLQDGWLRRLNWDGTTVEEYSHLVSQVPFAHDQLQSRAIAWELMMIPCRDRLDWEMLASPTSTATLDDPVEYQLNGCSISDIVYSPLLGGFALVLSNGKAALLTGSSAKYHPSQIKGIFVPNVSDAVCCNVNNKYRLMIMGCQNSLIRAFQVQEETGAILETHVYKLSLKDHPDCLNQLGPVVSMQWSPYWTVLAVAWQQRGLGIFSVFGSLLWCSISDSTRICEDYLQVQSFDWGPEGYHLVYGEESLKSLSFVRSATINNPVMISESTVVLQSDHCVFLSPLLSSIMGQSKATANHTYWHQIQVPPNYLNAAWPLRYAALDKSRLYLAIAGARGLAHCYLPSQKWKLFGNENQERDFIAYGGLAWWSHFIVCPGYNLLAKRDEIRWYPVQANLDNNVATIIKVDNQILLMNLCGRILVTFDFDGKVNLYDQVIVNSPGNFPKVELTKQAEILLSELIPHPICVLSVQLTSLKLDYGSIAEFAPNADSLLVNVCGRLIMLHPQQTTIDRKPSVGASGNNQLQPPLLIASAVEQVWCQPEITSAKPHLAQAMWLHCGAQGMKIWMPLFPKNSEQNAQSFISKRIMLPFELAVYPLAVNAPACVVLGVDNYSLPHRMADGQLTYSLVVQRSSEVFLHHILRQLLKRNLGLYALQLAGTCRDLPYFSHVLELLLHEVLEEEATSSEPIPDPLLPRVAAFIQEFPEFFQTVAHCARKTEIALWNHLFQTVGNPKDLFEACLQEHQLDTAASYLIILQNTESSISSRELATQLLEATLKHKRWEIAKEIVRFLKSIAPEDIETPPRTPLNLKQMAPGTRRVSAIVAPSEWSDEVMDPMIFQPPGVVRQRHSSVSSQGPLSPVEIKKSLGKAISEPKVVAGRPSNPKQNSPMSPEGNPVVLYINMLLARFAREQLATYRLKDLGSFAAHLEFHLVLWLGKERNRAAKIGDFVVALRTLHEDFAWPYPILTSTLFEQIRKLSLENGSLLSEQQSKASAKDPLKIITANGGSVDSGFPKMNGNGVGLLPVPEEAPNVKRLLMHQHRRHNSLPAAKTEQAVLQPIREPSVCTEDSALGVWDDASSYDVDWESVETLTQQLTANGGPEASETQLRFLQQLMLEANCVDYSVMLCLLLRDPVGVTRAVSQHSLGSLPEDTLPRLKRGIRALLEWADGNCLGYIPLMQAFLNHFISLGPAESESSTATSGPSTPRTESRATVVDQQTANAQDSSTPGQAATNRKSPYAHPQLTIDPDVEVELVSGSSPNEQREGCFLM